MDSHITPSISMPIIMRHALGIIAVGALIGLTAHTIAFVIEYWELTLALGATGLIIYWIGIATNKAHEKAKRRQAAEAARKAAEVAQLQSHQAMQQSYRGALLHLCEESIALFESMPKHLRSAEQYLDQAEVDFADSAFAPFWDSIEHAAKALGRFDESIHHIKDNASRYTELLRQYEGTPPPFSLARQSVAKLGVGTTTAERMKNLVRTAQRNFQFSTIYEQRRTNKILVAGFTNLAQALEQMTWQITTSIDDLAGSVDVMTSTLNKSMHAIHARMGNMAAMASQHHDAIMKESSERATREKKVLEMLDNIQRGRRPFP
jgi:hypothetical protein